LQLASLCHSWSPHHERRPSSAYAQKSSIRPDLVHGPQAISLGEVSNGPCRRIVCGSLYPSLRRYEKVRDSCCTKQVWCVLLRMAGRWRPGVVERIHWSYQIRTVQPSRNSCWTNFSPSRYSTREPSSPTLFLSSEPAVGPIILLGRSHYYALLLSGARISSKLQPVELQPTRSLCFSLANVQRPYLE
jgi:hypothetical protein